MRRCRIPENNIVSSPPILILLAQPTDYFDLLYYVLQVLKLHLNEDIVISEISLSVKDISNYNNNSTDQDFKNN